MHIKATAYKFSGISLLLSLNSLINRQLQTGDGNRQTVKQTLYKPLGFVFLSLGLLGIPLPVLPSTPFILLAAWFFARSSEKWHQRLLASDLFGPMILNWEDKRCISRRSKQVALISMLLAGGASMGFAMESREMRLITTALLAIGCATVLSIKTCPEGCDDQVDS
jgi:uncharacterized membrane protein YbaN (DUF454 family)